LDRLHAIPVVASDLPIRRQQAALGVTAAEAQLEQARWDALYDVTRSYLAVVYAQLQEQVAMTAKADLKKVEGLAKDILQLNPATQASIYYDAIDGRQEAAKAGQLRALAALREAVGLPRDACIT